MWNDCEIAEAIARIERIEVLLSQIEVGIKEVTARLETTERKANACVVEMDIEY